MTFTLHAQQQLCGKPSHSKSGKKNLLAIGLTRGHQWNRIPNSHFLSFVSIAKLLHRSMVMSYDTMIPPFQVSIVLAQGETER